MRACRGRSPFDANSFPELAHVLGATGERATSGDRFDFRELRDMFREHHDGIGDHFAGAAADLHSGTSEGGFAFDACALSANDVAAVAILDDGLLRSMIEQHKTVPGDFLV